MYLFVAMVMLMMVMVVVVSPGVSPIDPTITTVRVEHCNVQMETLNGFQEPSFYNKGGIIRTIKVRHNNTYDTNSYS